MGRMLAINGFNKSGKTTLAQCVIPSMTKMKLETVSFEMLLHNALARLKISASFPDKHS